MVFASGAFFHAIGFGGWLAQERVGLVNVQTGVMAQMPNISRSPGDVARVRHVTFSLITLFLW